MPGERIKFALIGMDHNHVYNHAKLLLDAGAEFAGFYSDKPHLIAEFKERYPDAYLARSEAELLEDESIDIIGGAAMPSERARISIAAMRHGKDVVSDKPAVVSLAELDEIEKVQKETGRIWTLYINEHYGRRCSVKAGELVAQGAIGRVVQTSGFGPHYPRATTRPDWFFDHTISGGIIGDIGAHQIEQFLFFTGSTEAKITNSLVGNFGHPQFPEFEDYGEVSLEGNGGLGWFRVDWYTPRNIGVAGDIRLFVLGTEGYLEMRKYYDPAGRPGTEHLFMVNKEKTEFIDTENVEMPFGRLFLEDVRNRTYTAISQERCFLTIRLATEAELGARRFPAGSPTPKGQGQV